MNKLLVAMPVINEKPNLEVMIPSLLVYLKNKGGLLIIDDNSNDGTLELVETLQKRHSNLYYIRNPKKVGLGNAYKMAMEFAVQNNYEWFQQMDADRSHRIEDLEKFDKAESSSDMIVGSRYVEGGAVVNWPLSRRILSKGGSLYAKIILWCGINDLTGGFNRTKVSVLKSIDYKEISTTGYAFQIELKYRVHKKRFKITEVPIVFSDRTQGKTKMSKAIIAEAVWKVWWLKLII